MSQLLMKLPALSGPDGNGGPLVRLAGDGDAGGLARLLGAAFPETEWSVGRVGRDLLGEPTVASVHVIPGEGQLLATASARYNPVFPGVGYVHWVGVDPIARGRNLGAAVMADVLARFASDGITSVVLETDDERLPAIRSYLAQGFVPQYSHPDHEARWSAVFAALAAWQRNQRII